MDNHKRVVFSRFGQGNYDIDEVEYSWKTLEVATNRTGFPGAYLERFFAQVHTVLSSPV